VVGAVAMWGTVRPKLKSMRYNPNKPESLKGDDR